MSYKILNDIICCVKRHIYTRLIFRWGSRKNIGHNAHVWGDGERNTWPRLVYIPGDPSYEPDELDNAHVMIVVLLPVGGNRTHVMGQRTFYDDRLIPLGNRSTDRIRYVFLSEWYRAIVVRKSFGTVTWVRLPPPGKRTAITPVCVSAIICRSSRTFPTKPLPIVCMLTVFTDSSSCRRSYFDRATLPSSAVL